MLRLARSHGEQKVERLAATLHNVAAPPSGRRTLFVEDGCAQFSTRVVFSHCAGRAEALAAVCSAARGEPVDSAAAPSARGAHKELEQRKERLRKLRQVERELEAQRIQMGTGRRRKVGEAGEVGGEGARLPVYKFAQERKR